jgi:hypothetical protein
VHAAPSPPIGEGRTTRQVALAQALARLTGPQAATLPRPGGGQTVERWRQLADVAARSLPLAKLYEGHADALAIVQELSGVPAADGAWATWCAEPPTARLSFSEPNATGALRIHGTKAWCSGAALVDHAVVSGWNAAGAPCLATVSMRQPGVHITDDGWHAAGMADTCSVDVVFDGAVGQALGAPHAYVQRPGFWHGGAGIAACWWGGALGIARAIHGELRRRPARDAHQRAHLGEIDIALSASAALLREAACWIDRHPTQDARAWALRVRLAVERDATSVMWHAGRAVGAGPLCKNAALADAMADLPVFMRQSHAERDLAALGDTLEHEQEPWTL